MKKNVYNMLVLMFFVGIPIELLSASQLSKFAGRSVVLATQLLIGHKTMTQPFDPHEDLHNFNIMDADYFDNSAFKNKNEKSKFLQYHFDQIKLSTDVNHEICSYYSQDNYSRYELARLMKIAQTAAFDDQSDVVKLKHLERGHVYFDGYVSMKLDRSLQDIKRTAYHEAGHAVMLIVTDTGRNLLFVSIQPYANKFEDRGTNGYVSWFSDRPESKYSTDQLLNAIKMNFAGGISDLYERDSEESELEIRNKFILLPGIHGDFTDNEMMRDILLSRYDESSQEYKDMEEIVKQQFRLTCKAVKDLQPAIKAVAKELLQEKVISGKRVAEIVKATMKYNQE